MTEDWTTRGKRRPEDQQLDYAWAAGFFDGEGNVHINKNFYTTGRLHINLTVQMVQKDRRPLDKFAAVFDDIRSKGSIHVVRRHYGTRSYWQLGYGGWRAAAVLQHMLPYLTLKREVAEVGIELSRDIQAYKPKSRRQGLTPAIIEYRTSLFDKVKWLNTGRWAAATTKRVGPDASPVCDSLDCNDDKVAEHGRNDRVTETV